ncbi:MAG: hypothetical protein LC746_06655 [Acidobacteria bacterium]|nr:hypothetical protein [Acidobacteriota bacterium]
MSEDAARRFRRRDPDNPSPFFQTLRDVLVEANPKPLRRPRAARLAASMPRRAPLALPVPFLVCLLAISASAQSAPQAKSTPTVPADTTAARGTDEPEQISHTEEMLRDIEIKREEALYKENVERAKETAQLAAEVRDAYRQQQSLGAVELKKLGRIEKLLRSLRNELGGDDDEAGLKDPPAQTADALDRLVAMSDDLSKRVEKTPRHVVSAAIINAANQLIELTKRIRTSGG